MTSHWQWLLNFTSTWPGRCSNIHYYHCHLSLLLSTSAVPWLMRKHKFFQESRIIINDTHPAWGPSGIRSLNANDGDSDNFFWRWLWHLPFENPGSFMGSTNFVPQMWLPDIQVWPWSSSKSPLSKFHLVDINIITFNICVYRSTSVNSFCCGQLSPMLPAWSSSKTKM